MPNSYKSTTIGNLLTLQAAATVVRVDHGADKLVSHSQTNLSASRLSMF